MNKGLWALLGLMGLGLVGILIEGLARPRIASVEITGGEPLSPQEVQLSCIQMRMLGLFDTPVMLLSESVTPGKCPGSDEVIPYPIMGRILPDCQHQGEGRYTCPPSRDLENYWRSENNLPYIPPETP